jgi:hypothetical protein
MADQLLSDLISAVDAVGDTFDGRGSEVRERELELALESALRALGSMPRRQAAINIPDAWHGRIGGVDLRLDASDGADALIELKWDATTLAACAWDSLKLACALQSAPARRGFLIAGSPITSQLRGDELLDTGSYQPADLRRRYQAEFDYWKHDVMNRPLRAPASWSVRLCHLTELRWKGQPWRIRLAEVELVDTRLVPVE